MSLPVLIKHANPVTTNVPNALPAQQIVPIVLTPQKGKSKTIVNVL